MEMGLFPDRLLSKAHEAYSFARELRLFKDMKNTPKGEGQLKSKNPIVNQ